MSVTQAVCGQSAGCVTRGTWFPFLRSPRRPRAPAVVAARALRVGGAGGQVGGPDTAGTGGNRTLRGSGQGVAPPLGRRRRFEGAWRRGRGLCL